VCTAPAHDDDVRGRNHVVRPNRVLAGGTNTRVNVSDAESVWRNCGLVARKQPRRLQGRFGAIGVDLVTRKCGNRKLPPRVENTCAAL
jgi:hypothetical protein